MLTIENIIQFVLLLGGIITGFLRFNDKTKQNSFSINQLNKDVKTLKEEGEKDIKNLKEDLEKDLIRVERSSKESYDSLKEDLKSLSSDICEIKNTLIKK